MKLTEGWAAPPERLELAPGVLHVWRASLLQDVAVLGELERSLSGDELERASRFRFEKDRRSFVVARGALRDILSRYLFQSAATLNFEYTSFGKPYLAPALNASGVCFNVSHSGELALYAVALNTNVGVDVELIRPDFAGMDIAERYFSPNEIATLRRLKKDSRTRAFFDCWARKEAFMKADGRGLSLGLDQFDVTLSPLRPAQILRAEWDADVAEKWSLRALEVHSAYAAAVAAECKTRTVEQWRWEPEGHRAVDHESRREIPETRMAASGKR